VGRHAICTPALGGITPLQPLWAAATLAPAFGLLCHEDE
jgi:hypothetical protein